MRTHRSRLVLAAVIGAGVLGAGATAAPAAAGVAPVPPAVTAAAAASPSALPPGWRRCANPAENFSVGYPGSWHTTQIRPEEVCRQFHPDPFTIPPESEYPLTALNVRRVPEPPSRTGTEFERTLLWQRTTVAGRPAVRFETVSTGAGMEEAGTRHYGFVVRLGGGLVSVHTIAVPGETRYASWKRVVDRAARTLTATPPQRGCVPVTPGRGFYEAGRVATAPLTAPASRCSTISVSHIADPANPADRCQTFRVGFWPLVDGALTYTEPVTACGEHRTVLARGVPDNARYIVLYDIDYFDPEIQRVTFTVWH